MLRSCACGSALSPNLKNSSKHSGTVTVRLEPNICILIARDKGVREWVTLVLVLVVRSAIRAFVTINPSSGSKARIALCNDIITIVCKSVVPLAFVTDSTIGRGSHIVGALLALSGSWVEEFPNGASNTLIINSVRCITRTVVVTGSIIKN